MNARGALGAGFRAGGYSSASNDDRFFVPAQKVISDSVCVAAKLRFVYGADTSETLSSVEDLWLRLARHPAVHAEVSREATTGAPLVMFQLGRDRHDHERVDECSPLLLAASSGESYMWSQDGSRGSLASNIRWLGNTLVVELVSGCQMRRWHEGEALELAMQGLLQRMKTHGAHKNCMHFA